ncbi:MAG: hypothetical protein ACI9WS_001053 [Paraglaciecola psychrophila]|jgi:hypothetical protein
MLAASLKWFLALILLLLLSLAIGLLLLPAKVVPLAIDYASEQGLIADNSATIALDQLSGTLWNGRSEQAVLTIDGGTVDLGTFEWQLDAMALWQRSLSIQLQTNTLDQQLQAHVVADEHGTVIIKSAEGHLQVALLEPWIPLLIDGKLAFVIDNWVFKNNKLVDLSGVLNFETLDWLGGDRAMALGSYLAHLSMRGPQMVIDIDDFSASLGVDGSIVLDPSGHYHFTATLQTREDLAPEVAESVLWFGKQAANGDILINNRGRL